MTRTPDPQEALVLERIAKGQEAADRAADAKAAGDMFTAQLEGARETHWLTGALFADRGDMGPDFVTFEIEQSGDNREDVYVFHSGALVQQITHIGLGYKAALIAGRDAANRHRQAIAAQAVSR